MDKVGNGMTKEELAAIRERAEKATKGPWIYGKDDSMITAPDADDSSIPYCVVMGFGLNKDSEVTDINLDINEADAAFITNARTDIPRLLDEIDRLNDELIDAKTLIERLQKLEAVAVAAKEYVNAEVDRAVQMRTTGTTNFEIGTLTTLANALVTLEGEGEE